jgi:hypothetical protein
MLRLLPLGLVIDNYVNKIDHTKVAVTLSKKICSDEKTSQECHNLLQEFVSRSCTALKLKEDLGILYADNHAIYDKINSYLGKNYIHHPKLILIMIPKVLITTTTTRIVQVCN